MNIELENRQIYDWWLKLPDNLVIDNPTFYHNLKRSSRLLFIGLNPAGKGKDYQPMSKDKFDFLKKKCEIISNEEGFIFGGKNGKQYKKYYGIIEEVANSIGCRDDWEYIDLFHFRYTNSKPVKSFINDNIDLVLESIERLIRLVNSFSNLKAIVVNNVQTAIVLEKYLALKFIPKELIHRPKEESKILNKDLVFYLRGIMSMGRMDRYEKIRLIETLKKYV